MQLTTHLLVLIFTVCGALPAPSLAYGMALRPGGNFAFYYFSA